MKGSRSESAGVTKSQAAPVRTQVAFTHAQSKAVNKAKAETKLREESLWNAAKDSVLEYTNSDDEECAAEQEDYEYESDEL